MVTGVFLLYLLLRASALAVVLTPPYFNIAENRKVEASSTCGEDVAEPELYCKLVGAVQDYRVADNTLIHGQVCDVCDPTRPDKSHEARFAVDGAETYWISPPLSRGTEYNEVNFTISLGQDFHVAYVIIKMGISPRPSLWVLEKSSDNGATYKPWQYFAESYGDCEHFFGISGGDRIFQDDTVVCRTDFSKIIPLEHGEIVVNLLQGRPSANDFFNSSVLQEWTRATNVRLRLLRTQTLNGHLMSVERQDPTVTRRYFYSIKDISIGGRCRCNGHADVCIPSAEDQYILVCKCQHNTCGSNCEMCCENKVQKKWRQSKSNQLFVCEECNCHGHSERCSYNETVDAQHLSMDIHGKMEGGGVCIDCRDNTEGINCETCKPGFYRPYDRSINQTNACVPCNCDGKRFTGNCAEGSGQCECKSNYAKPDCNACSVGFTDFDDCIPCRCDLNGTMNDACDPIGDACPCKYNFEGERCDSCKLGFYEFPKCTKCNCNSVGSLKDKCDKVTGHCECKSNFSPPRCSQCANGYFLFPECNVCDCDPRGTLDVICNNSTGECLCKKGFGGPRCDRCMPEFTDFPNCVPCNCTEFGSISPICDISGKCSCSERFSGKTCNQCSPGFYDYPKCTMCGCDPHGTVGKSCNNEGHCNCKPEFEGKLCDKCKEGLYNYPHCEVCDCVPAGVTKSFLGCGSLAKGELCECKPRVQGRKCQECRPLFWNLQDFHSEGCIECDCYMPGVLGGVAECDNSINGQCHCKKSVDNRQCDTCKDGTYNLQDSNLFGCTDCGCDIGGSLDENCDKVTGRCRCKNRIEGRTCSVPFESHYFPTLHQLKYELEEGYTADNNPVRYGFEESVFPKYSWKGYAVFSHTQRIIKKEVFIEHASFYQIIIRYVNRNDEPVTGTILLRPDSSGESEQNLTAIFKPTMDPAFMTVSGAASNIPTLFIVAESRGKWEIIFETKDKILFIDYFVLMPASYYEGNILVENIKNPCTLENMAKKTGRCLFYKYPNILQFQPKFGRDSAYISDSQSPIIEFFTPYDQVLLSGNDLVKISSSQPEIRFNLEAARKEPFVLVVNYFTPFDSNDTTLIDLDVSDDVHSEKGKLQLTPCGFAWLCRQVAVDEQGRFAVFNMSNQYTISLSGGDDVKSSKSTSAIESVTAIPLREWNFGYVEPAPVCVMIDGDCQISQYPNPLDLKKIEFENEPGAIRALNIPEDLFDKSTGLVSLKDSSANVTGRVTNPGVYIILVHYSQPFYPDYKIDVSVNTSGSAFNGTLLAKHCPSNIGCRSAVTDSRGNDTFYIADDFAISFKGNANKSLWLDYVLVTPEGKFKNYLMTEEPVSNVERFKKECGGDSFYVGDDASEFCRESIFSLTTHFNNGALKCECHADGSHSLRCNQFGGQCECRDFVIGRKCELCKTGYYGFPECRPCDCPLRASCDAATGECTCPPNVEGAACEKCKLNTYGYDVIYGCSECDCHPRGVVNGNLQCDIDTGLCSCRPNIAGRNCNMCKPGHHSFPHCEECDCDLRGTTKDVCHPSTAECYCKANVEGGVCDLCREGSYNLDERNRDGCTECFCFNRTMQCSSSSLFKTKISGLDDWVVAVIQVKKTLSIKELETPVEKPDESIAIDLTREELDDKVVYFSAPDQFLGNRLTSYGGYLNFSIFCTTGIQDEHVSDPNVILSGAGLDLLFFSIEVPSPAELYNLSLTLNEKNFKLPNGLPVTREHLMQVLQDLQAIYIRATYWKGSVTTRLQDVYLDSATEDYNGGELAVSVEQCECPPQYTGLSCEDCAPGYYRSPTGPYGGFCVPCQCHNHADSCDKVTGVCHNCQHDTTGDHCEKCAEGFHGVATDGTPNDCLICACPLPMPRNNFATSCEVSPDNERISCNCKPGYYGDLCETCAVGFYGSPSTIGSTCKPCECSGNIDTNELGSCDTVTGECIKCLNNTFGRACEICRPGYFGDAVHLKNCQSCSCEKCGTARCDHNTGICECQPNVVGEKCDRCIENHYGFDSCLGCRPCNCQEASESMQCDDKDGKCRCKPGVTGRTCDRCDQGYWNLTSDGCTVCSCHQGYSVGVGCNPETGKCQCLPGVIGEKCDHCPHRWVLEKNRGCSECDKCTHDLLDSTDHLHSLLDPVSQEFESVAQSYFTNRRLKYINETVDSLRPNVSQLEWMRINLEPTKAEIDELSNTVEQISRQNARTLSKVNSSMAEGLNMGVLDHAHSAVREAQKAVLGVEDIAQSFDGGAGFKSAISNIEFEESLGEAKKILERLNEEASGSKIKEMQNEIEQTHLSRAKNVSDKILGLKEPVDKQEKALLQLRERIAAMDGKILDLRNISKNASTQAKQLAERTKKNKELNIPDKYNEITALNTLALETLEDTDELLKNVSALLATSSNTLYTKLNGEKDIFNENVDGLDYIVKNQLDDAALAELRSMVNDAVYHAEDLKIQSEELKKMGYEQKEDTDVVKAYTKIVNELRNALITAEAARNTSEGAIDSSGGLGEQAIASLNLSSELQTEANKALNEVESDIEPKLNEVMEGTATLLRLNTDMANELETIESNLDKLDINTPSDDVLVVSAEAIAEAMNVSESIAGIVEDLPRKINMTKKLTGDKQDGYNAVTEADRTLDQVAKVLPDVTDLVAKLKDRPKEIDSAANNVKLDIEKLKKQVELARELANNIKIAASFDRDTTLELKNPNNLPEQGINNYVSLYFKTKDSDGLLFFLGNEKKSDRRNRRMVTTGDFMALEIQNGQLKFTVDLGSGPTSIISDKRIEIGRWYQAIMERTGKSIRLTVNEAAKGSQPISHIKEGIVGGQSTVLNLDKATSKLFVGGFSNNFSAPTEVYYNSFNGAIEDVVVGNSQVGLWNFEYEDNLKPATERDELVNTTSSTGCRFNGDGYVALETRSYRMGKKSEVSLDFKTFSKDGLMFLSADGDNYLSIEIREGRILYQFDLGSGVVTMVTPEVYNDGEWHHVETSRLEQRGNLRVDGNDIQQGTAPGSKTKLSVPSKFYIGGYPGEHQILEVTNVDFDGCIDQVKLDSSVDLNKNLEATGITPGCPQKVASVVSFEEGARGWVLYPNVTSDNKMMELILRFKTATGHGLIAYAVYDLSSISLWLEDGQLVFKSGPTQIKSQSLALYNDSEWHVVLATYDDTAMKLFIDDSGSYSEADPPKFRMLHGDLYFGGVPSNVDAEASISPQFSGCISDATLNGVIINFGNLTETPGAIIGKCAPRGGHIIVSRPPTLPPSKPKPPLHEDMTEMPPVLRPVPDAVTDAPTTSDPLQRPKIIRPDNENCALPLYPNMEEPSDSAGYRLGTLFGSRLEFTSLPTKLKIKYEFYLEVKTTSERAVVFFAANSRFSDFIAVYILDGKVNYAWNCGSGEARLMSAVPVNDGQWHKILFKRHGESGTLIVDEFTRDEGKSGGSTKSLNVSSPYYVGGIDPIVSDSASKALKGVNESFDGCLKNLKVNGHSFGKPKREFGVVSCSGAYEDGVYFSPEGGYLKQRDKFTVGSKFSIKLMIRPRVLTGVLIAIHGKGDYLLIELVDGILVVRVYSMGSPFVSSFVPAERNMFCDGNWHEISMSKMKHVISLGVDAQFNPLEFGDKKKHANVRTKNTLYVGGHPSLDTPGIESKRQFVGCIKVIDINGAPERVNFRGAVGNVTVNACPIN